MARHESFAFKSSSELLQKVGELGIKLPFQDSITPLFGGIQVSSKRIMNRLAVQPMEGFDAKMDGSPSELTFRRYQRYGEGGSGLIWFEATSVVPEGRSNPRQLLLTARNLDSFKRLVEQTRLAAYRMFGNSHEVYLVLQLTHSGRYSRPEGIANPQVACLSPLLDANLDKVKVFSDSELDRLQDEYLNAACLAGKSEFDAVDIKACHGYLVNDLLAAHSRENSRYGGSFENRTRFLSELVQNIRSEVPAVGTAVRFSAYDGIPYGFGVSQDNSLNVDLTEPKKLVSRLVSFGCSLFNITVGNPFLKPHLGRPFDRLLPGASLPEEHPFEGIARLLRIAAEFQKEFPEVSFIGTGYSWLRQFFPYVGAAVLERREAAFVGLGRSSFAYPDAPRDLMSRGVLEPKKVCITCSRCSELMRNGRVSGCAVQDKEIYGKEYQKISEMREENEKGSHQN